MLYVAVAFLGVATSERPLLTSYRVIEIAAVLIVIVGAVRSAGPSVLARMETVLYWFVVAIVASIWIGVAAAPSRGIEHLAAGGTPWTWSIQGALPLIASNGVGLFGVVLTFWSLGRASDQRGEGRRRATISYALAVVGVVTAVSAQYRTGYVALVVGLLIFLVARRKVLLLMLLATVVATVLVWTPSLVTSSEPVALRGQSVTQARGLSGRVDFWSHAVPVWEQSPWIGKGLITATRFDVLAPLGYTLTAGIHSTWIEALVGTGLLGIALLGASFLFVAGSVVADQFRSDARIVPLLLVAVLGVHSITGNSFEALDWTTMVFLWLALGCGQHRLFADSPKAECES
jgi:hypothetical protein